MFIRGLYLFDGLGNFLEPHMTNTVTVPRFFVSLRKEGFNGFQPPWD